VSARRELTVITRRNPSFEFYACVKIKISQNLLQLDKKKIKCIVFVDWLALLVKLRQVKTITQTDHRQKGTRGLKLRFLSTSRGVARFKESSVLLVLALLKNL